MKNKTIIIISPEAWGTNFVSKHHYAVELSKRGNKVWFINPATSNQSKVSYHVNNNLTILPGKMTFRGKNRLPKCISRWANKIEIKEIIKQTGIPDIVWSFDPYRYQWLTDFGANINIYHTVDRHPNAKREYLIAKQSDLVLSTSDTLFYHLKTSNPNCYKIPHGCYITQFNEQKILIPGNNSIKACYVGNLYKALNFNLIVELIQHNNDVDFLFIGPIEKSNIGQIDCEANELLSLKDRNNVFFIGSKQASLLDHYLSECDINFVAYKSIEINPHKLMSYFSSGNVTISTPILEYRYNSLLLQADTIESFLALFQKVKTNLDYYNCACQIEKRKDFAEARTYSKLIDYIEHLLNDIIKT